MKNHSIVHGKTYKHTSWVHTQTIEIDYFSLSLILLSCCPKNARDAKRINNGEAYYVHLNDTLVYFNQCLSAVCCETLVKISLFHVICMFSQYFEAKRKKTALKKKFGLFPNSSWHKNGKCSLHLKVCFYQLPMVLYKPFNVGQHVWISLYWVHFCLIFLHFCIKILQKCENFYQHLECTAPKRWPKYTTWTL